ncbi:MAG: SLC13 family permease [Planctomycetota bacterium]
MSDQTQITILLLVALGLFVSGRLRQDLIAFSALCAAGLLGLVPHETLFSGFGHPAVVSVAMVLIFSKTLQIGGVLDPLVERLSASPLGPRRLTFVLTLTATGLSAFMNNVGALALVLPISLEIAARRDINPARFLIPVAFGSILGGLCTLIGTPPNLILSNLRAGLPGGKPFGMFEFAPVGAMVAVTGALWSAFVAGRLFSGRETEPSEPEVDPSRSGSLDYVVPVGCRIEGRSPASLRFHTRAGVDILGIVRARGPVTNPLEDTVVRAGDRLVLHGDFDRTAEVAQTYGLLPLERQGLRLTKPRTPWAAPLCLAMALLLTTLGVFPIQLSLALFLPVLVLARSLTMRQLYEAIDWSTIVLLASLLPLGQALVDTGAADSLSETLATQLAGEAAWVALLAVFATTTALTNVLNNAATAAVMAPVVLPLAEPLNVSTDALLMTVALGASCAFLTPIAHQNNLLVMGPGRYRPVDFLRAGWPITLWTGLVGVPTIVWLFG